MRFSKATLEGLGHVWLLDLTSLRAVFYGVIAFSEEYLHFTCCLWFSKWCYDISTCDCLWPGTMHLGEGDLSVWTNGHCSYYVHTQTWVAWKSLRKKIFQCVQFISEWSLTFLRYLSSVTTKSGAVLCMAWSELQDLLDRKMTVLKTDVLVVPLERYRHGRLPHHIESHWICF